MSKIIKLAKYTEIEAHVSQLADVTVEEIDAQIEQMMANQTTKQPKAEGALEIGDIATIDFEGFKDDVAFDGGAATDYDLQIGSHTFIPGFEEQMIGMTIGEKRDLLLTFPQEYPAENLAGADVVFKVTLKAISTNVKAELTDAFIANLNIPEITTVEQFREYTKAYIQEQKEREALTQRENAVLDQLIEGSEVELTEEDIEKALDTHISHIEMDVQSQGVALDQYLEMMGMTREALREQLRDAATQQAKFEAIIDEIIRVEGIGTTDDELNEQADALASQHGISREDVLDKIPAEEFKRDMNRVKASQVVLGTAKFIFDK